MSQDCTSDDNTVDLRVEDLRKALNAAKEAGDAVSFDLRDVDSVDREAILRLVGLEFDSMILEQGVGIEPKEVERLKADFRRVVTIAETTSPGGLVE